MKQTTFVTDILFDLECDVADTKNLIETAADIFPNGCEPQYNKIYSIIKVALDRLKILERQLDGTSQLIIAGAEIEGEGEPQDEFKSAILSLYNAFDVMQRAELTKAAYGIDEKAKTAAKSQAIKNREDGNNG